MPSDAVKYAYKKYSPEVRAELNAPTPFWVEAASRRKAAAEEKVREALAAAKGAATAAGDTVKGAAAAATEAAREAAKGAAAAAKEHLPSAPAPQTVLER